MRRFFWLILIGLAYLFWRIISRKPRDPDLGWRKFSRIHKKSHRFSTGGEMVKDPVCESYLPRERAVEAYGHYFCSKECAEKWSTRTKSQ
ncbi:MAG TPA: hypothetical protein PK014_00720 [Thermoanaerobaculia bacterium]|nr:hypothetical protein [Thermoanaerobaculia bacterium]HUM29691.1 hypothetical protein [Thermoanaerobaculia bacterium]